MIDIGKRKQAIDWLNGRRDVMAGIALLQGTGFRPSAIGRLARQGASAPDASARITHLMREYLKVCTSGNETEAIEAETADSIQTVTVTGERQALPLVEAARVVDNPSNPYPIRISTVIRNFAKAYRMRAQLHRQLIDMPEDNSAGTVSRRKEVVKLIEALSDYMDGIYPLYEKYLKDGHDCEKDIEPVETVRPVEKPDVIRKEEPLPDLTAMDKTQLRRLRKSVATKIGRARNMLDYQQETRAEKSNPLPDGAKRVKYESRIDRLTSWLQEIDVAIARLG